MAKVLQAKPANKVAWVLIILLILGLAGFGIGGFSTSVRAIGSVGDQEISVDDYVRALQREISSFSEQVGTRLSLDQAIQFGIDRRVLEGLFLQAAIDNEASRIGVSVGDDSVLERLYVMPEFWGAGGRFDRSSYEFSLERSGLSAAEFDELIRNQETRRILTASISGGFAPPRTYQDRLVEFHFGTREFEWAAIGANQLPEPVPQWTEGQLRQYYDDNPDQFTTPERREVTYASSTPEMLSRPANIGEAELRAAYDARSDDYNIPERRAVDRLVFPNRATAENAKARLEAGGLTFDELLEERGVALADAELGDVSSFDLTPEAADLLFASDETGIFGPVTTELGPAIFRVNAILAGRITPFAEARRQLVEDLALDLGRDRISENMDHYEDLLAGGATLEELASDTELELAQLSYGPGTRKDLAVHQVFRTAVQTLREDDFPELKNLPDGGVFAARLDNIVPPTLQPFESVRDQAAEAWTRSTAEQLLADHVDELRSRIATGRTFEELGLQPVRSAGVRRSDAVADSPPDLAQTAFELGVGEVAIAGEGDLLALVRLDAIAAADPESPEVASARDVLASRSEFETGVDAYRLFSQHLQSSFGISLDHATLNAIHAQLP